MKCDKYEIPSRRALRQLSPIAWFCHLSDCQLSTAELFRCRPPDLEFFTGARRHGSNTPVLQETLENVLTATIVLTSTLVVLEVTSVTYSTIKIN